MGLVLEKKVGDAVKEGDVLAYIHGNDAGKLEQAGKRFLDAYEISQNPIQDGKGIIKHII